MPPPLARVAAAVTARGAAAAAATRGFATDLAPGPALKAALGVRGGPGGRSSSSGLTVTVFGATGFLGRYLVNQLAVAGHRVVLPYRCDELDVQHLRQMGDLGQVVQVPGFDVRSKAAIEHAVSDSNAVFNLIAARRPTRNFSLDAANRAAAAAIAGVAAASPSVERFVQVSCVGAAPGAPSERLRTKAAGDAAVTAAFPAATLVRTGQLVGVEDAFLNVVAAAAKAFPAVPLIGGGSAKRAPVAVADVARALAATLRAPDAAGRTYELVGPDVATVKQLALLVLDLLREPRATAVLPASLARALVALPLPKPAWLAADVVAEAGADLIGKGGPGVGTFADLGVVPESILAGGGAVDHLRWLRAGGYDVGTTSGRESTGGAGFGASVA